MSSSRRLLDICPKVVPAGAVSELVIRATDDFHFQPTANYEVQCFPREAIGSDHAEPGIAPADVHVSGDGKLHIRFAFLGEQEYAIFVYAVAEEKRTLLAELSVYSLEDDLFALRPFKGDFHMHSNRSDGKDSPAHVAAACRRIGLDFMALTDHRQYQPSLDAIAAFADMPIDLKMYPGEEVHPPENTVHIVNFGGRFSINALFDDDTYRREVSDIEQSLSENFTPKDRYRYASCVWCYEKIRQAGGLSLFCHPYWIINERYCVPESLIEALLRNKPFDAFEIIGGFPRANTERNALQIARYHEERAKGRTYPIVGVSDAHGCERDELFGWYYTIVWAPSADLSEIINGVKSFHSVAIEAVPDAPVHIHGPFRLVKYAYFLLREVFPAHDALCREEGELMMAHLTGDATA
ncbi:MAG TPA: hypothetical protein VHV83_15490, partial [Armatimonadota bacterium]|nr:hypothetical protein [Armatimonadota bacterium]